MKLLETDLWRSSAKPENNTSCSTWKPAKTLISDLENGTVYKRCEQRIKGQKENELLHFYGDGDNEICRGRFVFFKLILGVLLIWDFFHILLIFHWDSWETLKISLGPLIKSKLFHLYESFELSH